MLNFRTVNRQLLIQYGKVNTPSKAYLARMNLPNSWSFALCFLWITVNFATSAVKHSEALQFYVNEECRKGTVIATGRELGIIFMNSNTELPRIINQKDPGASSLSFRLGADSDTTSNNAARASNLQLVVDGRLDRESICPPSGSQAGSAFPSVRDYSESDFYIESSSKSSLSHVNLLSAVSENAKSDTFRSSDCAIQLKVATNNDGVQNIHQATVYIQDINDNPPVWLQKSYILHFKDGDPVGSKQPVPLATDTDRGVNAVITYRLQDLDVSQSNQRVEEFASLQANRMKATDMFELLKESAGTNSQGKTYPTGQTLLRVHATDADEGGNAEITYGLVSSPQLPLIEHFFELTTDGELRVRQRLEVDKQVRGQQGSQFPSLPTGQLAFDVQAVDSSDPAYARTGYATIRLTVEDVNDEAPQIRVHPVQPWSGTPIVSGQSQAMETELAVAENEAAGKLIGVVEVTDPDNQSREIIRCSLIGKTANFFRMTQQDVVGNEYQLFTAVALDREQTPRLILSIECRDLVDHISMIDVGVNVVDVNDHSPQFQEVTYQFSVLEDDGERELGQRGTPNRTWSTKNGLAFVTATDEDDGMNHIINYRIKSEVNGMIKGLFSVDNVTGQLFALGPFDREQTSRYRFIVLASDNGKPPLTGSCTVDVTILDTNDNPPSFSPQRTATGGYTFSVRENLLPGTRIGQIQAYDMDSMPASSLSVEMHEDHSMFRDHAKLPVDSTGDDRLTYGLKDGTDAKPFWIDPKSGMLSTRIILDREKQATYTFHATVRDGPPNTAQKSLNKPESSEANLAVSKERVHEVSIIITVTVEDENDNDPVFLRPNSTNHMVLLDPAAIPGQTLLQVNAIDPDEGLNGKVMYTIRNGNAGNLFHMDQRTGLLYLQNQIPRKTISEANAAAGATSKSAAGDTNPLSSSPGGAVHPTYLLALEACDQGEPKRCTHFPNLQIQLRVPSEHEQPESHLLFADGSPTSQLLMSSAVNANDPFLSLGERRDSLTTRLTVAEITIITLSAFFSLLILIIVFVVCVLRRHTNRITGQNTQKDPRAMKLPSCTLTNTVELTPQSENSHLCSKKFSPLGVEQKHVNRGPAGRWNALNHREEKQLSTVACTGIQLTRSPNQTTMEQSFSPYGPEQRPQLQTNYYGSNSMLLDYGLMNATFPSDITDMPGEYQALECWTAAEAHQFAGRQVGKRPNNIDLSRLYYTQRTNAMEPVHLEYREPYESAKETGQKQVDLQPIGESGPLEVTETVNDFRSHDGLTDLRPTIHIRSHRNTKADLQAYAGFPKSSFV
ncbi:hypothetical protein P879_00262 [Paragonimus westermani]|uniref:Cadherin domain-containing protein n=1 Tax=Paragonimus westermani TaxID=34504 RepID=A0A8T0DYP3_9TREM|nr:hypothetical protein P879_00262 [Paragonimus westermani]